MLFTRLLAAIHLILILQAPVTQAPPVSTAPAPSATPAPAQKEPAEKTMTGSDEAVIWIVSKKPRVKVETRRGVSFDLDFATHGALCLTHISAELNTEPKGITLSFNPADGMLSASYDKDAQELRIFMRGGKEPLCKLPVKLSGATTRVLLRQREQLALFAIPPDGSHATLAWLGSVYYVAAFRNAAQYELCRDLKITMGKRDITPEEFRKGVKLDALDEIADVVVRGTGPSGEPFQHRYTFDYKSVTGIVDAAYGSFMKAAGNDTPEEEAGIKTAPLEISQ